MLSINPLTLQPILVIGILIVIVLILILCDKSTFNAFSEYTSTEPSISEDTVFIFYAPWCGHCKASMKEFEDAVSRGQGKVVLVDSTDKNNKDLIEKYNIQGYPTIIKANRERFSGSRTADDIIEFSKE